MGRERDFETVVLGAGPAGLTAGYLLAKQGRSVLVLEKDEIVGGLARTEARDGYRFDLGGHRFFTKSPEVERLWHETLSGELLLRPRMSRIYYDKKFLNYPLAAGDVIRKLGVPELTMAGFSYMAAVARSRRGGQVEETFEDWVSNRFGRRLFQMFFKSYTEKVWGVPTSELRAEWAAQRIKGLSFKEAVRASLFGNRGNRVKSLIEEFHYPRLGPGQMWEAMRDRILANGGDVRTGTRADALHLDGGRVAAVRAGGEEIEAAHFISSLPLPAVVGMADPAPSRYVLDTVGGLRFRDFLTVALVVEGEDLFPDTWIYVHDPDVRVARIQNYRSWSPAMVPDPSRACVGLEYFCFEGDDLWTMDDATLVELAKNELMRIGLADRTRVERGYVVRVPKAYPIYDAEYAERVALFRGWLDGIENLQQVGRNGLHRYNNSDHSMLTAMRAVENLDGADHDIWSVNADSWYHEEQRPEESPYRVGAADPADVAPAAPELAASPRSGDRPADG